MYTVLETSPDDAPRFFSDGYCWSRNIPLHPYAHKIISDGTILDSYEKQHIYIVCHLLFQRKILCHLINCYFLFFSRGRYYTSHDASVGMGWSWRMDTDHLEYSKAYRLVLSSLSTCGLWETSQRMPRVVQKGFAFIHLSLPSNETAVQHVSLYYDNQSASAPFKKR